MQNVIISVASHITVDICGLLPSVVPPEASKSCSGFFY